MVSFAEFAPIVTDPLKKSGTGFVDEVVSGGTQYVTKKLVDEIGGRTGGLAVSNAGPDAVNSLSTPRGAGTPSPDTPTARNIAQEKTSLFDTIKANWKIIAGVVVVGAIAWKFLGKKRGK